MIKVRQGVFETNSSSTHSISITPTEEFLAWKNGELWYDDWNNKFVSKEERDEIEARTFAEYGDGMDFDDFKELVAGGEFDDIPMSFNEWSNHVVDWYGNQYVEEYTTEHGDNITVWGYYGYL